MDIALLDRLSQARPIALPETSDLDPAIRLNGRWRVIACRAGIQWILQYRASAETYSTAIWRGRSYCRTSGALIRCCKAQHLYQAKCRDPVFMQANGLSGSA